MLDPSDPNDIAVYYNQYNYAAQTLIPTINPDGSFDAVCPFTAGSMAVWINISIETDEVAFININNIVACTYYDYYQGNRNMATMWGGYIGQTFKPILYSGTEYLYIYPTYPYTNVESNYPIVEIKIDNHYDNNVVNIKFEGVRICKMPRTEFFSHFES